MDGECDVMESALAELQAKLAAVQKERDKLEGALKSSNASAKRRGEQLAAVTQELAALRETKTQF
jgi:septal ring factor EnvC (AmiA/AmiB activator)